MGSYLTPRELFDLWREVCLSGEPHATLRIGDSEAAVAAHGEILTMDFINKAYAWVQTGDTSYCGVMLPNEQARAGLVDAFRAADCLGILSQTDRFLFKPLADMVVLYYGLDPKYFFYAFDNYYISLYPDFYEFFKDKSVVLVGEKSEYLRDALERRYGWRSIAGTVDCAGWEHLDEALAAMDRIDYRVALVSAGVPGKVLTAHAKMSGRAGFDFGCGTDACIEADAAGLFAWEMTTFPTRNFIKSKRP